jgi:glycosyltransferase involved in cell wall biosynthesis
VVFSHLRWSWVWQRPQHLIARLARTRNVWFVEEPIADASVDRPITRWTAEDSRLTVVRTHVPGSDRHMGFDSPEAACLGRDVAQAAGGGVETVWLYTPLALAAARALRYRTMVFDVMDDLASFKGASPQLPRWQRETLAAADVVLAGGRSLHRDVLEARSDAHLFPSGVDAGHYAEAASRRSRPGVPVAGYVGVIDERLDLELLAGVAARLPDWQFTMVGPVAKISEDDLPRRNNISYVGAVTYEELPAAMAGFHVALMPFALNEATRKISPTKTLEYLAAGLPVVSTRVPDVVTDYAHIVRLADDPESFATACAESLGDAHDADYHATCKPLLEWSDWNRIAARIEHILGSRNIHPNVDMDETA